MMIVKKYFTVGLILLILFFILIHLMKLRNIESEKSFFLILEDKERVEELTIANLREIPHNIFSVHNKYDFHGFELIELFNQYGFSIENYSFVELYSSDGFMLRIQVNEIKSNKILLVWDNFESQNLRIVIPRDDFEQRWLKYLIKISLF